jgi:hypothetical protein
MTVSNMVGKEVFTKNFRGWLADRGIMDGLDSGTQDSVLEQLNEGTGKYVAWGWTSKGGCSVLRLASRHYIENTLMRHTSNSTDGLQSRYGGCFSDGEIAVDAFSLTTNDSVRMRMKLELEDDDL